MSVSVHSFGRTPAGQPVYKAILKQCGMEAHILSYAGILQQLWAPDRAGRMVDVVLGYDDIASYELADNGMGAVIGRFANRIGGARFSLCGSTYHVTANQDGNCLHSGTNGFGHTVFEMAPDGDHAVALQAVSADGTDGFPGTVKLEVRYELGAQELCIRYTAVTDAPTVINITNHSYFNLNGHGSGSVLDHRLQLDAARYLETDSHNIPTGRVLPVAGTPMDFTREKALGRDIKAEFAPVRRCGGYDHCLAVPGSGLRHFAWLTGPKTGIRMRTLSTEPGVQLFTANGLRTSGAVRPKEGAVYAPHGAVCLETENYPDAPNHAEFPDATLVPSAPYRSATVFRFDIAPL